MSKLYRKKPVVIEAIQWTPHFPRPYKDNFNEVKKLGGSCVGLDPLAGLIVSTLEGEIFASPLDYIIKGVKGEVYPCKPDVFDLTYELVE